MRLAGQRAQLRLWMRGGRAVCPQQGVEGRTGVKNIFLTCTVRTT